MAKIKNYLPDNNITDNDIVIGSDGDVNGTTKNFNVATLKEHILKDLPGTPTLEQVVTAGNSSSKDIILSNAKKIKSTDSKKFLEVDATSARIVAYGGELPFPDTEARVQVETSGAVLIQGEAAQINVRSATITGQDLTFKGLEYTEDNSANFVDRSLVDKGYVDGEVMQKADLVGGKVPSEQLPSYVDDVIEVANFAGLPLTGESGKIYITIDDNKSFRWGGSVYVEIASANKLGLIKIVDKSGDFFTDLATASAYIRTFTSATITDESFSNGTFWFTVPNGSSFNLAPYFLGNDTITKSAYIEDRLGLIANFENAFYKNSGNNILGNCTFGDYAFYLSSGDNTLGNCTFKTGCFNYATGINKFKNILLQNPTTTFAYNASGRFEIYGNVGTTEAADYTSNFFTASTAVIWAQKAKETSNAGGIEGDLATAQTNGAKLFFGYANAGGGGGTPFSKEEFTYAGVQTFTLAATPAFIAAVFVNGQELNTTQFSTLTNVLTIVDTLETGDKVNILYNPASVGIAEYYTKTEIDNFNFEENHPNFVEVNSLANLPTQSGGVIELIGGYTYLVLNHLDLLGSRLVCGQDTVIVGWSSENCSITSTGLSAGTALITSVYSLPIRSISFTHGTVFDLNGDGTTTALDWFGVNILNSASAGTIKNYSNFIMESSALLNSGGFTFDGAFGTVGFGANCLFDTASGTTAINVLSTCTISRRFRIVYSSFVNLSGETGINFSSSATVNDEKYILDTVNFSGGGTYLTGVNDTSNKALFSNCVGITNTSTRGFMYMLNNVTDTTIGAGNANVWIKAAGTTIAGTNSKYTHTTNRLTYIGAFVGSVLVTVNNVNVRSGSVNQNISIGVAKNGIILPESEGIVRTSTANTEYGGSTQAVLEIASTDYIELFVRNTSVSDVRITDFSFNIIKIPV